MVVDFMVLGSEPAPGSDDELIYKISVRFNEHFEAANFTVLIPRGESQAEADANAYDNGRQFASQVVIDLLD